MTFLSVLFALLIFGILIFIHELGHFLVARAFGVKILEFSIGMGPKLFSKCSKKSGTRYSLRLIPIGGFVSMYGENGMEAVQGEPSNDPPKKESAQNGSAFLNDIATDENTLENTEKNPELDSELEKQAYCNKSVWVRILISLAGPLMNLLLGFLLMMILIISAGPTSVATTQIAGFYVTYQAEDPCQGLQKGDYLYAFEDGTRVLSIEQLKNAVQQSKAGVITVSVLRMNEDGSNTVEPLPILTISLSDTVIDECFQTSLTAQSGLQINDVVLKVNQTPVHTFAELSYEIMNQGVQPFSLTVRRNGEKLVLSNVTVPTEIFNGVTFGKVDFLIYQENNFHIGTILKHTFFRSISTVKMVFDSIKGLFTRRYGLEAISGPVGITKTISDVTKSGQNLNLLYLVIVISINLGVMNLLPLPALDGGHLLLYVVEAVRGKPIKREIEGIINFVGLILILILAVIITIKDVISL